jgi:hypothetical protein
MFRRSIATSFIGSNRSAYTTIIFGDAKMPLTPVNLSACTDITLCHRGAKVWIEDHARQAPAGVCIHDGHSADGCASVKRPSLRKTPTPT